MDNLRNRKQPDSRKRRVSTKNNYKTSGGSPLWSTSTIEKEESQKQVFRRQDKLRQEIMLKEQQLAELADRSQRMRLKIGSYAPSPGNTNSQVFSNQEMS